MHKFKADGPLLEMITGVYDPIADAAKGWNPKWLTAPLQPLPDLIEISFTEIEHATQS